MSRARRSGRGGPRAARQRHGPPGGPPAPRRGRRWRAAFFALAAFAIVAGVAWALLGNRLLVVRSVTVTGTHLVSPAQVIAAADVPPGTPLLRVDTGAVTRRVEAIPQVASARVTADWPDHLVIAVTERVPVLAVKMAGGGYDLVDQAGVPVRWAKNRPPRCRGCYLAAGQRPCGGAERLRRRGRARRTSALAGSQVAQVSVSPGDGSSARRASR